MGGNGEPAPSFASIYESRAAVPPLLTFDQGMKTDHERLIDLCSDLLEGRKGIIEASREMGRWRCSVGPEDDPDFLTFTGIDSETDHLPVGSSREKWQAEALKAKDREIQEAETFFRARAFAAASNLIKKYQIEQE